jgi:ketosteroid isomerase-like protein
MKPDSVAVHRAVPGALIAILLLLVCTLATASPASAQKKKKNDTTPPPASPTAGMSDEQKIDYIIGQMLAAWQIGDTAGMHKYFAEDVSVVSGVWAPPAMGWTNYLAAYQVQRSRMQQVRMERSNTLVRVAASGNIAWACYQWEFTGIVDGAPSAADGQTTLILEKHGDDWLIIHNHTSLVQASQPATPANPAPQATSSSRP